MISALDISTSALIAQRTRLNAISSNLANMSTVINEDGEVRPYQPRYVEFQIDESLKVSGEAVGVKVSGVRASGVKASLAYILDG